MTIEELEALLRAVPDDTVGRMVQPLSATCAVAPVRAVRGVGGRGPPRGTSTPISGPRFTSTDIAQQASCGAPRHPGGGDERKKNRAARAGAEGQHLRLRGRGGGEYLHRCTSHARHGPEP